MALTGSMRSTWVAWALVGWLGVAWITASAASPAPGPAPAPAGASDTSAIDALITRIQAKYAAVTTLDAAFTQKTGSALYGEDVQTGTLVLERPGKMRWEFADGRQYVCDGETMWIYTPADKSVLKIHGMGAQAATADAVLQSLHQLRTLFDVTDVKSTATSHALTLAPKTPQDAQFKRMVLVVDSKLVISQVKVTDVFDSVTTLDFSAVKLGNPVPASRFVFEVPPGVHVVDGG